MEGMGGSALTSSTLTAPLGRQLPGGPPASSPAPVGGAGGACVRAVCSPLPVVLGVRTAWLRVPNASTLHKHGNSFLAV